MFKKTLIALAATAVLALAPSMALAKGGKGGGGGGGFHGKSYGFKHGSYKHRHYWRGRYGFGLVVVGDPCWVKVYTYRGVRYDYVCY